MVYFIFHRGGPFMIRRLILIFALHRKSKVYDPSCAILFIFFILTPLFASADLYAQADQKPEPDVVVFPNGEKLIGHFESFSKGSAKFKSDTLGEVTVDLSKVQELHTSARFAVIRKDVKLARGKVTDKSLGDLFPWPTRMLRSIPEKASRPRR